MMALPLVLAILIFILFIWNIVLTYFYISSVRYFKKLKPEGLPFTINDVLQTLVTKFSKNELKLNELEKVVLSLKESDLKNISYIGLKRFNPYDDTGGDLSFSLALLDKNKDGVVISSLHGRAGTRVYSKAVQAGNKQIHELSKDEKDAILEALR